MNTIGSKFRQIFTASPQHARPAAKTFGDKFARGTEDVSDLVNISTSTVAGGTAGFALGTLLVQGAATALGVAGAAAAAPVGLGLAIAGGALIAGGAGLYAGNKAGKWLSRKAGALGERLLGKTLGTDKARAAGKGTLALLASAPISVGLGALAIGGTTLTALGQAANGIRKSVGAEEPQEYLVAR